MAALTRADAALAMVVPPPIPTTAAVTVPAEPWDWFHAYCAAERAPVQGYALVRACLEAAEAAEARGEATMARNLLLLASGATHRQEERIAASAAI